MRTESSSPVTAGAVVVPYGHAIGNEKWRGSEIAQRLQGKHNLKEEKQSRQSIPLGLCFTLCLADPFFVLQPVSRLKISLFLLCVCVTSSVICV